MNRKKSKQVFLLLASLLLFLLSVKRMIAGDVIIAPLKGLFALIMFIIYWDLDAID